jgi:hypothetical protein
MGNLTAKMRPLGLHTSSSIHPATRRSRRARDGHVGLPCARAKSQCPHSAIVLQGIPRRSTSNAATKRFTSTFDPKRHRGPARARPRMRAAHASPGSAKRKATAGAAQWAPAPKRAGTALGDHRNRHPPERGGRAAPTHEGSGRSNEKNRKTTIYKKFKLSVPVERPPLFTPKIQSRGAAPRRWETCPPRRRRR